MAGSRLLTSLTAARISYIAAYSTTRAIHVLPTISTYFGSFNDENNVGRHRQLLLTDSSSLRTLKRYKSGKKKRKQAQNDESDDEDDEAEDAELEGKSAKVITTTVNSLRIDLIVKVGMGISRTKAETALYESKIRINGEKVIKKSIQVKIGDVIDVVRGPSPKNPDFIVVSRLTIVTAFSDQNGYKIKFIRDRSLVIENYEDGWTPLNN